MFFGPFGHQFNSVVATFSHKMARNETPKIDVDGDLKLIYVGELVREILKEIRSGE
jgi:UDP-2-acetamido-2,6-beta-L-arabino-hexul-4-ose reductase